MEHIQPEEVLAQLDKKLNTIKNESMRAFAKKVCPEKYLMADALATAINIRIMLKIKQNVGKAENAKELTTGLAQLFAISKES